VVGTTATRRKLKLGDRVRFTQQMAGFKVERYFDGHGSNRETTKDPTDGLPDRWRAASERLKELVTDKRRGTFRVVVVWDVVASKRRMYDLKCIGEGIIVGKTFRYEGKIHFEDGWMSHVGPIEGGYMDTARRVPCWEVKQTLNRKAALVPLDAVELIDE
jgi:hypothetical protein